MSRLFINILVLFTILSWGYIADSGSFNAQQARDSFLKGEKGDKGDTGADVDQQEVADSFAIFESDSVNKDFRSTALEADSINTQTTFGKIEVDTSNIQLRINDVSGTIVTRFALPFDDKYIQGMITDTDATADSFFMTKGSARDASNSVNMRLLEDNFYDLTSHLEPGTVEASDTWYYIYLVGDTDGVLPDTIILSINDTGVIFPTGYEVFRLVNVVRNNPDSDIYAFAARGEGNVISVDWSIAEGTLKILNAGTGGSYTDIDASDFMPHNSRLGLILMDVGATGPNTFAYVRAKGQGSSALFQYMFMYYTDDNSLASLVPTDKEQKFEFFESGNGSLDLFLKGFVFTR